MKNFFNFRYFSTVDLKHILSNISLFIIIGAISFSAVSFIQKNIDPQLISLAVSIGTKQNHTAPSNIAQTMLHVALPAASFEVNEPVALVSITPQTTEEPNPTVTPLSYVEYKNEK